MSIAIHREPLDGSAALALIAALNAELLARYPEEGATHFRLDRAEVAPGQGAFLVARRDAEPIGCGAVRRLDDRVAEVKRMYVVPAARGRRVGRAILAALATEARALGVVRLVLETGARRARWTRGMTARRQAGARRARWTRGMTARRQAGARRARWTRGMTARRQAGARQPEALALYRRAGFADIPRFGEYVDSALSLCMAKDLGPA